ncbi:protein FIP1-like [Senna tora]|uniref:Protein FIP1-like n=1 Tax=Senna tora TaxID=362788 RepID=A0A834X277_9FABA|nr:protein FIP1-like [Senna tora]
MATERHASTPATLPEENALFLDILHEAPLFAHRKPARAIGSIFYCLLLASWLCYFGHSSSMDFSPYTTTDLSYALYLRCFPFINHRYLSTISGLPSSKNTLAGTAAMLLFMVWKPRISFLSISAILRYHEGGRLSDQQMALLQYQRENLHFLSEEILRLQECLSKYERTDDGSTPQVDLAHLLAARDQELRTLSAEMNQLQSELRLARSLIAERDSEILRVRTTNNQYVEENERLRAILGEWSTRAAKLERALEAERMSNLELQRKINQSHASAEQSDQGA